MRKLSQKEVLRYQKGKRSQDTVKRHYKDWRSEQDPPIHLRCDNPICCYHSNPLIWNGIELKLVLDHVNGVNGDNRPENLQFLCPNCNSQQKSHGGGNKGKSIQHGGGFALVRQGGEKDYVLPAEAGEYKTTFSEIGIKVNKNA